MSVSAHPDECPYCAPPFGQFTDDHVFPHFLGGRATIRVCRTCNSSFGHSFEGESSKQMNQLQVFVSHFGLDLTRNPAVWPSALTVGDSVYNLKTGPTGTQYELANPIIRRDESGKIVGYQPRSRKEGEVIARSLIKKGKAKRVEMNEVPGQAIEGVKLGVNLSFNLSL
jgi:hypothetical protein